MSEELKFPKGLEQDLAYIDEGHDILYDELKKGMPIKDAVVSLNELYTRMDNWKQKYPSIPERLLELTQNDMRELGFNIIRLALSDWREERSYAYFEGKRWRETTYSLSDLVWKMDARRARHDEKLEDFTETKPIPVDLDSRQKIPVVKSMWEKAEPYFGPVAAAGLFLLVPVYKMVAKQPDNLDWIISAFMTLPGASVIANTYLAQKARLNS